MRRTTRLLVATALAGSLSPALAQDATQGGPDQSCTRLSQLTQQNKERFRDDWVADANRIAQAGNVAQCARYVEAAEKGIRELDARQASSAGSEGAQAASGEESEESRIVVTQPQPDVTVKQDSPEVTVQQAQPQVTVRQPEPEIIVKQVQPTVHVQIPQPTITIDQPQPEIIVRMPEPEVGVSLPEPQVEVSQQQPQVSVEQAKPQVQVQMEEPDVAVQGERQAEVQVERGQPVVRSSRPEEAQVHVEQAQPKVSYQQAEPKVEFEAAGEPKVQFNTTGEPNIRIERSGQQAAAAAGPERGAQQGERQAATDERPQQGVDPGRTASVDRGQELPDTVRQRLGEFDANQPAGEMSSIRVSEMVDKKVVNRQGEEIGTIERVVVRDGRQYVVLASGGLLGLGEREVALPVDRLSMSADDRDRFIILGMTEADLEDLPGFDVNSAQQMEQNQSVEIRQG